MSLRSLTAWSPTRTILSPGFKPALAAPESGITAWITAPSPRATPKAARCFFGVADIVSFLAAGVVEGAAAPEVGDLKYRCKSARDSRIDFAFLGRRRKPIAEGRYGGKRQGIIDCG